MCGVIWDVKIRAGQVSVIASILRHSTSGVLRSPSSSMGLYWCPWCHDNDKLFDDHATTTYLKSYLMHRWMIEFRTTNHTLNGCAPIPFIVFQQFQLTIRSFLMFMQSDVFSSYTFHFSTVLSLLSMIVISYTSVQVSDKMIYLEIVCKKLPCMLCCLHPYNTTSTCSVGWHVTRNPSLSPLPLLDTSLYF